jgi:phenylalanyl-tRNA synthetase beta chain
LLRDDAVAGYLGELHPDISAALDLPAGVLLAEFDLDLLSQRRLPQARPVPRFPAVRRDLAVEVADDLPWAAVERSVRRALGERLAEVRLFDQYQGPGLDPDRKSLAMGLILQDASRTLTDEEVDSCVKRALSALEKDCAARLRG